MTAPALIHEDEWLTAFFTASTAALAIFDSELRFLRVNQVLADLSGRAPEAHIGRPLRELFPDMADLLEPLLRRVIETRTALQDLEVSGETAIQPGQIRHWTVSYFPLSLGPGRPPGVGGVAVEVTARKHAEDQLRASKGKLRQLANRLAAVREEEARRIAREVHDTLGQQLTAVKLELQAVENAVRDATPELLGHCAAVQSQLDGTIAAAQRISSELRLGHLEVVGLAGSIEWYLRDFQRRTGIRCRTRLVHEIDGMASEVAVSAFRIFQEAMTNIARHARATEVEIRLDDDDRNLVLSIRDNGCGITPDQLGSPHAIGLLGMRERAQAVGGTLAIERTPAGGTVIRAVMPKQPSRHE